MDKEDEMVHRARFAGLTEEQAVRLVELDAEALWVSNAEGVAKIRAAYAALGLELTTGTMLLYAHTAAEHHDRHTNHWWVPEAAWLEALALAGTVEPLREFLLRRRPLDLAIRNREVIGLKELDRMAWAVAQRWSGSRPAPTPMREALEAFVLCEDGAGIRLVMRQALEWADSRLAAEAAEARGCPLAKREKLALCRAMIATDYSIDDRVETLRAHGLLRQLGHELILRTMDPMRGSYSTFTKVCQALDRDPKRYLGRWFLSQKASSTKECLDAASELACRKNPFWKGATRRTLQVGRADMLARGDFEAADRYGSLIGEPVTVEELTAIVNEGHGRCKMADEERRYRAAKAMLARRLTQEATPPADSVA